MKTKAQEVAERLSIAVEQVEEIWATELADRANEQAHRLHEDREAEAARNRMRHR